MPQQTYLWDSSVWSFIIQLGIIAVSILLGNTLRRKIPFIKKSLLPTAVIAGILLLVLKFIPAVNDLIDKNVMEAVTYNTLGLGFIAVALKPSVSKNGGGAISSAKTVTATGLVTVSSYLIQGIVGLLITIVLGLTVFSGLFLASGILLPLGFGQGPGQALNFGLVFEGMGFTSGGSFGLAVAAIGFLFACIGGVIYLNILKRKGRLKRLASEEDGFISGQEVSSPDEIPLSESVDKFTMQISIVLGVYFFAYIVMLVLSNLSETYFGDFGVNTLKPLIWGFNFLFGTVFAVIAKKLMNVLRKKKVMTRTYPNEFLLNRIAGFMFDVMIVSGIAAIEFENLKTLFIPLALICIVGGMVTFTYLRYICNRIYPTYKDEAFFSMFGMLTGTASTGMILLREVDPKFKTPAATNLVLQSLPAIVFGFPLLLLIPYSATSLQGAIITLVIITVMFVVFNLVLLKTSLRYHDRAKSVDIVGGGMPAKESGPQENAENKDLKEED